MAALNCLVCKKEIMQTWNAGIFTGDESTTVQFRGNQELERGRYRIHATCEKPEFAAGFLTMGMLEGKVAAHDPDVEARRDARKRGQTSGWKPSVV